MNKNNLEEAQKDIEEALMTVATMEEILKDNSLDRGTIKENFIFLSEKVQNLENILKEEGILD